MGDQQQQQIQQPLVVYPNTFSKPYPGSSSSSSSSSPPQSHSGGSFGTVFIVLAVILVLSALACVFGRVCNRSRAPKHQNKPPKQDKASKKVHEIRPVDREPREGRDLEFGFDPKRMPTGKPMGKPVGGNGGDIEFGFDEKRAPPNIKHGVRFKLPENGDFKGDTRHGGPDIEFRPGR